MYAGAGLTAGHEKNIFMIYLLTSYYYYFMMIIIIIFSKRESVGFFYVRRCLAACLSEFCFC